MNFWETIFTKSSWVWLIWTILLAPLLYHVLFSYSILMLILLLLMKFYFSNAMENDISHLTK